MTQPQDILHFWFEETPSENWWIKDPEFDQLIRDRFLGTFEQASSGKLDIWQDLPEGCLALIIILDQFPRNMFRDDPRDFATDELALAFARFAIEKGFDQTLKDLQKQFLYMPFMHSESLEDQEKGVELFKQLGNENALDYMRRHRDIIKRFGHFPHRNKILGRTSTQEEIEFLNQPGSSF